MNHYFSLLKDLLDTQFNGDHTQIYNFDQSGKQLDFKTLNIVVKRFQKSRQAGKKGQLQSLRAQMLSDGSFLQWPFFATSSQNEVETY